MIDGVHVKILDCENSESTYQSLKDILDANPGDIHEFFDGLDLEAHRRKSKSDPDNALLEMAHEHFMADFPSAEA